MDALGRRLSRPRLLIHTVLPPAARRSRGALFVAVCGPLTAVLGLAWAFAQPSRITFLHPHHARGFWYFVGQAPLLVILVGLLFHFLVALPLIGDIEKVRRGREER